ncbi:MAG: hypothetical protein ACJA0E_001124 [Bermanella sp.]|jgi:hypothetical protein
MEGRQAPIRIQAPKIEQQRLSFCDNSLLGFESWAKKLPMANVGAAAKLLFQAIKEMNITQFENTQRFQMLEVIRTPIYSICDLLSKRFLNQSVALSDNDIKIMQLTQTLQIQLATGYKHIVIQELSSKKISGTKLLTFAMHRAISDLNQTILRAYQLYSPPPQYSWLEIHQLFALSEAKEMSDYRVKDNKFKFVESSSINEIYSRALLLGCCKPNQLRQKELIQVYYASELWASLAKITSINDSAALFVFPQHRDAAPIYRTLAKQTPLGTTRGLNPDALVMTLQKYINEGTDNSLIPNDLPESVLIHLMHAWGNMTERSFRRTQSSGSVELGFGFLASHYFSANEKSLPFLLKSWHIEVTENKFKTRDNSSDDIWDKSFDAGNNFSAEAENIAFDSIAFINKNGPDSKDKEDTGPKGQLHPAQIINTSPGGYGVAINTPPSNVQTGELVTIKEPKMNFYALGCIRWIRSQPHKSTEIGIELITPRAESVAVRILNKTGENGEFLRALLVPAMPAAGQEETLILPVVPFKLGSKAELSDGKQQSRIQLLKRHNASRSFVQYAYKSLTKVTPKIVSKDTGDDEFASIWDKL